MTWSGFRPSDDAYQYGYLVPANMFTYVVLEYIEEIAIMIYHDSQLKEKTSILKTEIHDGIEKYGVVKKKGLVNSMPMK